MCSQENVSGYTHPPNFAHMKEPLEFANEGLLQTACYRWWKDNFRRISLLFAVPNGGNRQEGEARHLKDQGVTAGVFDLVLLLAGGRTCYIEMKNGYQELRPDQKLFKAKATYLGHECYEAYTLAGFKALLCQLLGVSPNDYA